MKIRLFILAIYIFFIKCLRMAPANVVDSQYRQANVPPLVSVLFDVPQYGRAEREKWKEFIKANKDLIEKTRREVEDERKKEIIEKLRHIGHLEGGI